MSHTPGPWDIKHLVDNRAVVTHKYDNGEHDTIAWVTWSFSIKTFDEVKANAALIAAAPELLDENVSNLNELKHLHDAIKRLPEGTFGSAPPTNRHAGYPIRDEILHNIAQRIEATEAAIKKAKGTP